VGDGVNIETDILGKYVEKLLSHGPADDKGRGKGMDLNFLAEHGYLK
jgi:riboflavin synthase